MGVVEMTTKQAEGTVNDWLMDIYKKLKPTSGHVAKNPVAPPVVSAPPTPSLTPDVIRDNLKQIDSGLTNRGLTSGAVQGLAKGALAGMGIGGAALVLKSLANSATQRSTSYTVPVEMPVYRPDRPEKKKRRKVAEVPVDPTQHYAQASPFSWSTLAAALGIGLPLGYAGANMVGNQVRQVAHKEELRAAQLEFEKAMQEYAESGDESRKLQPAAKFAAMNDQQLKLHRLAENLNYISKNAGMADLATKSYLAWATLSPLLAGVYAFNRRWDDRAFKDLDIAERQLNQQREAVNPTFSVATLKDPPDLDKKPTSPEDEEATRDEIRQALNDAVSSYSTDYL